MSWYYAESGQQRGPVNQGELENLVRAGAIGNETLVWREGMADWQPYGQVKEAAPADSAAPQRVGDIVCWQCGKMFAHDEAIRIGDAWVCATCKPIYVQRLREGAALPGAMEYAGFWIRFGAKFVDGIILRLVGTVVGMATGATLTGTSESARSVVALISYGLGMVIDIAYRTIFVGAFGATPGKMAAKVKIVNADGSKVSYLKAFARAMAEYISLLTVLIGYIMAAFDNEKRALHDRICGTRVVRNR